MSGPDLDGLHNLGALICQISEVVEGSTLAARAEDSRTASQLFGLDFNGLLSPRGLCRFGFRMFSSASNWQSDWGVRLSLPDATSNAEIFTGEVPARMRSRHISRWPPGRGAIRANAQRNSEKGPSHRRSSALKLTQGAEFILHCSSCQESELFHFSWMWLREAAQLWRGTPDEFCGLSRGAASTLMQRQFPSAKTHRGETEEYHPRQPGGSS
jgi:hypothetical protein